MEPETGDSRTEFGLGINYTVADNFYIFAEHYRSDRPNDTGTATVVGAVYEF